MGYLGCIISSLGPAILNVNHLAPARGTALHRPLAIILGLHSYLRSAVSSACYVVVWCCGLVVFNVQGSPVEISLFEDLQYHSSAGVRFARKLEYECILFILKRTSVRMTYQPRYFPAYSNWCRCRQKKRVCYIGKFIRDTSGLDPDAFRGW